MPVELTTNGTEEGTYVVTAAFTDEDGGSVVPNNINWWLYDSSNSIVNGRSNVAVAVPAASINIVLQGDDLAIIGKDNRRVLRVEYDYDSTYGSGLPGKKEVEFDITDLETYVGTLESTITLTVNTNTWATLAQANSYFEGKWNADGWVSLSSDNRKKLLITAYEWINTNPNYTISGNTEKLRKAQMELSWFIYNNSEIYEKHELLWASGVTEFRISKFWEKLTKPGLPPKVEDLLSDYDYNSGGYLPLINRDVRDNQ
jgi:hypothetical protein